MICDNCKINKVITDFINSKNICYKCLYRLKLEKINKEKTEKTEKTAKLFLCRTCGNYIINKENQKKRQRTVFCSHACAEQGHKNQLNNHWTKKIGQNGDKTTNGKSIENRSNTQNSRFHL